MAKKSRTSPGGGAAPGKEPSAPAPASANSVIVGIGASAGGLEAFSQVLDSLPARSGLVLVLVQHLDPQHESSLAELLASHSRLPVVQLPSETNVQPDHVYVIPPNRGLVLRGNRLVLQPRPTDRSQYTPVDTFFHSLAQELGRDAVGVILSGTGRDGVEGIHAIKAAGGTVLMQDPQTAKQDGMLRAALATGKVDLVLTPRALAEELVRLAAQRPAGDGQPLASQSPPPKTEELGDIFALLRSSSGVDFSQYKLPTLQRRIQRRMSLHRLESVAQYIKLLQESPGEVSQLYADVLIHVTRFFREPESFEILAREIFPSILEARGEGPLRIWVPACSTGEEPYSVAMTLIECLDQRGEDVPIQLFATDLAETAIDQARGGLYPATIAEDLSMERLRRFFTKTDGSYRINKSLRDVCVFARQDLTRDPPFSKLDLVVCRNVLIYLSQAVQTRLMSVFHYALKANGYLLLGSAETVGTHSDLFAIVDKRHRVYRKQAALAPGDMRFQVPHARPAAIRPRRDEGEPRTGTDVQGEASRILLDRYSPPGVIVNEDLRIVQFRGHTGKFLEPAPGDASLNLLKMCREGLLHALRTAIQNAKKQNAPSRREGQVKTNGDVVTVMIEVVPLAPTDAGRHSLIVFREIATPMPPPKLKVHRAGNAAGRPGKAELEEENERLQKELVASREYLQSIIQDLEAANEELQSANEEILSSNEELQSTNEELDTAKEELQSNNEELNTLNEELQGRNEELGRINSDLENILNGVQIAIVIVSGNLRIRRFTQMAERVLNLIAGDVGRPLSQIKPNIHCPDLERLVKQVMDTITIEQRDVQDAEGRMYSLTIRPYKSLDNRIDGAVLTLFDIDEARRQQYLAREAREYAEAVMAAVRHPLVVLDGDLRIRSVNAAFSSLFGISRAEAENRLLFELNGEAWSDAEMRRALDAALGTDMENFELTHEFPDLGRKTVRLSTRRIEGKGARPALILLELAD